MNLKEEFEKKFKISFDEWQKQSTGVRLDIARIHPQIKRDFLKLCNDEFCGDYGMCIKWLMDFKEGLLSSPNQLLADRIDMLAERIQSLESKLEEKKDAGNIIGVTASGKVMKR